MKAVPLRWRLGLGAGLIAAAVVLLVWIPFEATRARREALASIDVALREELGEAVGVVLGGGSLVSLGESHQRSGSEFHFMLYHGDTVLDASEPNPLGPYLTATGEPVSAGDDLVTATGPDGESYRVGAVELHRNDSLQLLVVATSLDPLRTGQWAAVRRGLLIAGGLALAVGTGTSLVSRITLRSVDAIRRRALAVTRGEEPGPMPLPAANDELRLLAEAFDAAIGKLHTSISVRDRLVAELGHELRTPLARLRTELDLSLRRPRDADELTAALVEARRHTLRLQELVEHLLDLARLRASAVDRQPTKLRDLVVDVVTGSDGVDVMCDDSIVPVDRQLMQRAVSNLIDNACRHGRPPVQLRAWSDGGLAVIEVRSRRADSARPRPPTGVGIGLTIVDEIARLHEGDFELVFADGWATARLTMSWRPGARGERGPEDLGLDQSQMSSA